MENEKLKNESIASVKAMMDYCEEQIRKDIHPASVKKAKYAKASYQCKQELKRRIKNIFP